MAFEASTGSDWAEAPLKTTSSYLGTFIKFIIFESEVDFFYSDAKQIYWNVQCIAALSLNMDSSVAIILLAIK